jgi:hypothetical protein
LIRILFINIGSRFAIKNLNFCCLGLVFQYCLLGLKGVSIKVCIKDEVLCDVVPVHASHILLGRPWQFDRKATYDRFKNRHSFVKDNKTITLVTLTLRQVYEDQMKLKRENELKKNCESESSKEDDEKESERKKESENKRESEENERKTKKRVFMVRRVMSRVYKQAYICTLIQRGMF